MGEVKKWIFFFLWNRRIFVKKIDETNLRIQKVTKEVDKANEMIVGANARLKNLLKKVSSLG